MGERHQVCRVVRMIVHKTVFRYAQRFSLSWVRGGAVSVSWPCRFIYTPVRLVGSVANECGSWTRSMRTSLIRRAW